MTPIITLTVNPSIDAASEVETIRPIRKLRTAHERYEPGGGGINVSRVIKELGGPTTAIYLAGGSTGSTLADLLRRADIDCAHADANDHTRISYAIFERSTRLEYRFVPEGPTVQEAEWRRCLELLEEKQFDYVVASGSLPRGVPSDFYVRVGDIARHKGARLVLDSSGPALRAALDAGGVYLVKPSLGELEDVAGRKLPDSATQHAAAMAYVETGKAQMVAVTLGRDGAFVACKDSVLRMRAPVIEPASAVGAGDSFVGAMTLMLAKDRPIAEAFMCGMAAGAAALLAPGTELCKRADVERLFAELHRQRSNQTIDIG